MNINPALHFEPRGIPAVERVIALEAQLGVKIPEQYRSFLLTTGGGYIRNGIVDCVWPTPFGECNITEFADVDGIERSLDSEIVPRNMICIGGGHFGMTATLSIAGIDHGCVYALDAEHRFYWTADVLSRP